MLEVCRGKGRWCATMPAAQVHALTTGAEAFAVSDTSQVLFQRHLAKKCACPFPKKRVLGGSAPIEKTGHAVQCRSKAALATDASRRPALLEYATPARNIQEPQ